MSSKPWRIHDDFRKNANAKSGGKQAAASAASDSLLIFTRSENFPETGCAVVRTSRVFSSKSAGGVPPSIFELAVTVQQEVFVSKMEDSNAPSGMMPLADRVTRHVRAGFEPRNGARLRFLRLLRSKIPFPVPAFDFVNDIRVLIPNEQLDDQPIESPFPSVISPTPTTSPSLFPSLFPSSIESPFPTLANSDESIFWEDLASPTFAPFSPTASPQSKETDTAQPVVASSSTRRESNNGNNDSSSVPPAAVAAAAGAGVGVIIIGFFCVWRCRMSEKKIPLASSQRHHHDSAVRRPKHGAAKKIKSRRRRDEEQGWEDEDRPSRRVTLGASPKPKPRIPSIVEMDDEERNSVEDSTLGSRTAGRDRGPPPPVKYLQAQTIRDGTAAIENSLPHEQKSQEHDFEGADSQISSLRSGTFGAGERTKLTELEKYGVKKVDTEPAQVITESDNIEVIQQGMKESGDFELPSLTDQDESLLGTAILSSAETDIGEDSKTPRTTDRKSLNNQYNEVPEDILDITPRAGAAADIGSRVTDLGLSVDYEDTLVFFPSPRSKKKLDLPGPPFMEPPLASHPDFSLDCQNTHSSPRKESDIFHEEIVGATDVAKERIASSADWASIFAADTAAAFSASVGRCRAPPPSSTLSDIGPPTYYHTSSDVKVKEQISQRQDEAKLEKPSHTASEDVWDVGSQWSSSLQQSRSYPPDHFPGSSQLEDSPTSASESGGLDSPRGDGLRLDSKRGFHSFARGKEFSREFNWDFEAKGAPGETWLDVSDKHGQSFNKSAKSIPRLNHSLKPIDVRNMFSELPGRPDLHSQPLDPASSPIRDNYKVQALRIDPFRINDISRSPSSPPPASPPMSPTATSVGPFVPPLPSQSREESVLDELPQVRSTILNGSDNFESPTSNTKVGISSLSASPPSESPDFSLPSPGVIADLRTTAIRAAAAAGNPLSEKSTTPSEQKLKGFKFEAKKQFPLSPTYSSPGKRDLPPSSKGSGDGEESANSMISENPWLFGAVADTLGPQSASADVESLSGKSSRSRKSGESEMSSRPYQQLRRSKSLSKPHASGATPPKPQKIGDGETAQINRSSSSPSPTPSEHSRSSRGSRSSRASRRSTKSNLSNMSAASRTVASDLLRLETQLSMLNDKDRESVRPAPLSSRSRSHSPSFKEISLTQRRDEPAAEPSKTKFPTKPIHNNLQSSSLTSVLSPSVKNGPPTPPRSIPSTVVSTKRKQQMAIVALPTGRTKVQVTAPAGKLGIILANRTEGRGTVVSGLRSHSPLMGKISPGDRIVSVDGIDVSLSSVPEITSVISSKSSQQERILAVVTPEKRPNSEDQTNMDENDATISGVPSEKRFPRADPSNRKVKT